MMSEAQSLCCLFEVFGSSTGSTRKISSTVIHNKKSSTSNFAVMEYDPSLILIDGGPI